MSETGVAINPIFVICDTICPTCLSRGRRLQPLHQLAHTFNALAVGLADFGEDPGYMLLKSSDCVCWECRTVLRRCLSFYNQVLRIRRNMEWAKENYSNLFESSKCGWDYEFEFESKENILNEDTVLKDHITVRGATDELKEEIETSLFEYSSPQNDIDIEVKEEHTDEAVIDNDINIDDRLIKPKLLQNITVQANDTRPNQRFKRRIISSVELQEVMEEMKKREPYSSRKYKCETCIVAFVYKHNLDNHNSRLHSEKNGAYSCDICKKRYSEYGAMKEHMARHYTLFSCLSCDFRCVERHRMETHCARLHDTGHFSCSMCHRVFNSRVKLKGHRRTHRERGLCVCDYCGKSMGKDSLVRHIRAHMGEAQQWLSCELCPYRCRCVQTLHSHVRAKHRPRPPAARAYCVECDAHFKSAHGLKMHLELTQRHARDVLRHECEHCRAKFTSERTLKTHIRRYHVPHECPECGHKLSSLHGLNRHVNHKHRDRAPRHSFVCTICNKSYKYKKTLKEHMWSHTGDRPLSCTVCGDTFTYSAALYTHNRLKHKK